MISAKNTIFPIEIRKTKIVGTEKIDLWSFYFDVIDTFQCSKHDAAVLQPLKKYVT